MARNMRDGTAGDGYLIEGSYEWALHRQCTQMTEADPRVLLDDPAKYERLKAEADGAALRLFEQRLAAGDPVEAPNHWVGRNFFPLPVEHPLRDRSVRRIRVHPDDRVAPVYR